MLTVDDGFPMILDEGQSPGAVGQSSGATGQSTGAFGQSSGAFGQSSERPGNPPERPGNPPERPGNPPERSGNRRSDRAILRGERGDEASRIPTVRVYVFMYSGSAPTRGTRGIGQIEAVANATGTSGHLELTVRRWRRSTRSRCRNARPPGMTGTEAIGVSVGLYERVSRIISRHDA